MSEAGMPKILDNWFIACTPAGKLEKSHTQMKAKLNFPDKMRYVEQVGTKIG